MPDNLKNIPNEEDKEQDSLYDYLNGKMSDEQQHDFETKFQDDAFMQDAVEGLEKMEDKNNMHLLVHELNKNLHDQVKKKRKRKDSRKIQEQSWVYFSVLLILLLVIVAYLVIKRFN